MSPALNLRLIVTATVLASVCMCVCVVCVPGQLGLRHSALNLLHTLLIVFNCTEREKVIAI